MLVNAFLYLIFVGMVLAFALGCTEAYMERRGGSRISEFPAMIVAASLLNWLYVWYFVKQYTLKRHDKE